MKVKIERIAMGTWLLGAKKTLARMSYLTQSKCDAIVDDLSFNNKPTIIALRGPFHGENWENFNNIFVYNQISAGLPGAAKPFVDTLPDEWDNDEWTDDELPEEDPTEMLLFCIKTNGKETGNKFEILVLATTEEIALKSCIQDRAVVEEIKVVPGPFTNGTVLSTKLIT